MLCLKCENKYDPLCNCHTKEEKEKKKRKKTMKQIFIIKKK